MTTGGSFYSKGWDRTVATYHGFAVLYEWRVLCLPKPYSSRYAVIVLGIIPVATLFHIGHLGLRKRERSEADESLKFPMERPPSAKADTPGKDATSNPLMALFVCSIGVRPKQSLIE